MKLDYFFLLLSYEFLVYSGYRSFTTYLICRYSLSFYAYFFTFSVAFFKKQKFLISVKSNLSFFFPLVACALVLLMSCIRSSCLNFYKNIFKQTRIILEEAFYVQLFFSYYTFSCAFSPKISSQIYFQVMLLSFIKPSEILRDWRRRWITFQKILQTSKSNLQYKKFNNIYF